MDAALRRDASSVKDSAIMLDGHEQQSAAVDEQAQVHQKCNRNADRSRYFIKILLVVERGIDQTVRHVCTS